MCDSIELTKKAKKTKRAELFGAFPISDTLTFSLKVKRELGVSSAYLSLYSDDDGRDISLPFEWKDTDYSDDKYSLTLRLKDICSSDDGGLFFYFVILECAAGRIKLSYDPLSQKPYVSYESEDTNAYQLLVYDRLSVPDWLSGGIMYQIFVDRFRKGGDVPVRHDAVMNDDWYNGIPPYATVPGAPIDNNVFFGGTLYGAAEKLDYIKSLGVSCIYLNPIFEAYSNHKYDTGDYSKIDEMFGGERAFELFLAEAEKRDIRVILDGVFNHTGSDSIYFNREGRYSSVGAYNSKDSEYYSWYDFEEYPDKYRCWWGIDILPSVHSRSKEFCEMINGENGIIRSYLKKGVSGWRLDVADELREEFLRELYTAAKKEKSDALVLGEVWEDASNKIAFGKRRRYFRGELDSVMNYPFKEGIVSYILYSDSDALYRAVNEIYSHYPKEVSDSLMNHIGTHDTARILTVLSGRNISAMTPSEQAALRLTDDERRIAKERLKIAYLLLSTLPGVPCIYYGDEIGLEGGSDPFNRMPYPWGKEDTEILEYYRMIGKMRREEPIFKNGYLVISERSKDGFFEFTRENGSDSLTVAVNLSDKEIEMNVEGVDLLNKEPTNIGRKLACGEYAVIKHK